MCGGTWRRRISQAHRLKKDERGGGEPRRRRLEKARAAKVVVGPVSVSGSGGTAAVDFGDSGDSDQKRTTVPGCTR